MASDDWRVLLAAATAAVVVVLVCLFIQYRPRPPLYYGSVLSVSGVGDDLGRQPVEFNLTLGVQSRSPFWRRACIERGTAVEVAYHGVALVYWTIDEELCAVPRQISTARLVVATLRRSNMSGMPEFVVGGLAADARRGVLMFDMTAWIPSSKQDADDGKVVSCMGTLVGDKRPATACDVHYSC